MKNERMLDSILKSIYGVAFEKKKKDLLDFVKKDKGLERYEFWFFADLCVQNKKTKQEFKKLLVKYLEEMGA